jgi:phenylalanyl-tRNA synthetase alpha chain
MNEEGDSKQIADMLSRDERTLLAALSTSHTVPALADKLGFEPVRIARNSLWLENKELIRVEEREVINYELTAMGEVYTRKGLPERQLFTYLLDANEIPSADICTRLHISDKGANIATGMLKKAGSIVIEKRDEGQSIVTLVNRDDSLLKEKEKVLSASGVHERREAGDETVLKELIKRGIVAKKTDKIRELHLTPLGERVRHYITSEAAEEIIETVTKDILEKDLWVGMRFRKYDIESPVPSIDGGRKHPLYWVIDLVRETFLIMGFREVEGPWIETAFWNMDSMFVPQDHPARDVQDTFYLRGEGTLPSDDLVQRVKRLQEDGWDTGSAGYGIAWDEQIAKKLVLRSHTTAVSYRMFAAGVKPPLKVFSIGRVFRNETPDKLHLPEFNQIEGFVLAEGLNLRHLMGYLNEFYTLLGLTNLRFKPTYNPYTEPSMEVYALHPTLNRWVEIANSGIFRPEARRPYEIKENVLAWGLALERLAGILFGTSSIRELIGHECDLEFIKRYSKRQLIL